MKILGRRGLYLLILLLHLHSKEGFNISAVLGFWNVRINFLDAAVNVYQTKEKKKSNSELSLWITVRSGDSLWFGAHGYD